MSNSNTLNSVAKQSIFSEKIGGLLIVFLSIALYANTLQHDFVQDDAIVIHDNMYTTQGVAGIPGILSKDTFYGFFKTEGKDKLVAGGRYRPLTLILFSVEWQIVGDNPFLFHLMNIVWYALLCFLTYRTLHVLLKEKYKAALPISIIAGLLFTAHPIHTEVVANIKGRDEILSMLGSIVALYTALKYIDSKTKIWLIASAICMFLGCMSKENAITYLAIIPLGIFFFRKVSIGQVFGATLPATLGVAVFLIIRTIILGLDFGDTPTELMNNPFVKLANLGDGNMQYVPFDLSEKLATICFTLGKYIQLLFFPHPLTHDYYPRHIEVMQGSDPAVILAAIMYAMLIGLVLVGLKRKDILTFGILYYLITLSIVSNIIFPIGTNMSERFLFMPSLGFALIFSHSLHSTVNKKSKSILIGILVLILGLYSMKTIMRNMVWENDFTLFNTDIAVSKRSAKLLNAVGGSLLTSAIEEEDQSIKNDMLKKAIDATNEATQIHPNYINAYLIQGNSYFHLKEMENAEKSYSKILGINPNHTDATKNLTIALRESGRNLGSSGKVDQALVKLNRAQELNPNDPETLTLLGIANGFSGNHQTAITFFVKALQLKPNSKEIHNNLSKAYQYIGNIERATYHANLAQQ